MRRLADRPARAKFAPEPAGPGGQQQWMARAWPTMVVLNLPTAQALLAEVAATADRRLLLPPGLGLATLPTWSRSSAG